MTVRLYPFGFVGFWGQPDFLDLNQFGFRETETWEGFNLFVRPDTQVECYQSGAIRIAWLGSATFVQPDGAGKPITEYASEALMAGFDEFHRFLDYVVGRWAAIVKVKDEVRIYNDTLALQPVYVSRDAKCFSSHLPLLSKAVDHIQGSSVELDILGQHKLWDETEDPRIAAIPANHYFNITDKRIQRFYPHQQLDLERESYQRELDSVIDMAKRSVRFWAEQPFELYVALTAGLDTRLCAAATLCAGVEATYVTYGSTTPADESDQTTARSYKIDVSTARKISRDFDLKSEVLAIEDAKDSALSEDEKKILLSNNFGRHALTFQGLYEKRVGDKPAICFVGGGIESVKDYYMSTERVVTPFEEFEKLVRALGGFSKTPGGRTLTSEGVEELWRSEGMDSVVARGFPVNNLFYWELRASRFQSEAINCQATAFMPINPLAFRAFFEVAQRLDFYERKASFFYRDFINGTYPLLSHYPVNGKPFKPEARKRLGVEIYQRPATGVAAFPRRQTPPDLLQLQKEQLTEGSEVFLQDEFPVEQGTLVIGYENLYAIGREVSNVEIFLNVNDYEFWSKGVGLGGVANYLAVNGLGKGDRIEFGVRSTKANGIAWSNVSRTRVLEWEYYSRSERMNNVTVCSTSFSTEDSSEVS